MGPTDTAQIISLSLLIPSSIKMEHQSSVSTLVSKQNGTQPVSSLIPLSKHETLSGQVAPKHN
jgi:hypothetical protein